MATWPENMTYICSATRRSLVNGLPIMLAGPDRIRKLIILVGAPNRGKDQPQELSEAINPAKRLARLFKEWGPSLHVELQYGDPDDAPAWTKIVEMVLE